MVLSNHHQQMPKQYSKGLTGEFITDESGWQHQNPLFNLSIAKHQTSRSNHQLRGKSGGRETN